MFIYYTSGHKHIYAYVIAICNFNSVIMYLVLSSRSQRAHFIFMHIALHKMDFFLNCDG